MGGTGVVIIGSYSLYLRVVAVVDHFCSCGNGLHPVSSGSQTPQAKNPAPQPLDLWFLAIVTLHFLV